MSTVDILVPLFYKAKPSIQGLDRPTWIAVADFEHERVFCVCGWADETTWYVTDKGVAQAFVTSVDGYDPLSAGYVPKALVEGFVRSYEDYSEQKYSSWILAGDCVMLDPTSAKTPPSPNGKAPTPKTGSHTSLVDVWLRFS